MTELARKLLDELLGPDRNKPPSLHGTGGVKFHDPSVCKFYLVDFCPYEAFLNTKSDIGCCPKRYHEESLKEKFKAEGEKYREEYEREFYQFIDKLVSDMERKLRRGRDRVDIKPNDPSVGINPANDELEEKRTLLDLQIKEKLALVEKYGEEGKVHEAQELVNEIDAIKAEIESLRKMEAENPLFRLEKRMEVCQTCGAFLIIGDAQKRIEAHYEGRQHTGWARVRQALENFKLKANTRYDSRRTSREPGEIGELPQLPLPPSSLPSRGSQSSHYSGNGDSHDKHDRYSGDYRRSHDRYSRRDEGGYSSSGRSSRGDHSRDEHYGSRHHSSRGNDRDYQRSSRSPPERRR